MSSMYPATLKSNSRNGLLDFRNHGQRSVKSRHQANFAERDYACSRAAVRNARFLQNGDSRSQICSRRPHRDGWSARTDLDSRRCATVTHPSRSDRVLPVIEPDVLSKDRNMDQASDARHAGSVSMDGFRSLPAPATPNPPLYAFLRPVRARS